MKKSITVKNFLLASYSTKDISWTIGLTFLAVITPAILAHTPQNQWITGTIVNALLFLATWKIGIGNAFFVAVMPSTIALLRGLLPAPMAMLLPFIIISNLLLIITFAGTKKRPLLAIITASLAKFSFLFLITSLFFSSKISSVILTMLQFPQLITALAGGILAIGIIKVTTHKSKQVSS